MSREAPFIIYRRRAALSNERWGLLVRIDAATTRHLGFWPTHRDCLALIHVLSQAYRYAAEAEYGPTLDRMSRDRSNLRRTLHGCQATVDRLHAQIGPPR